MKPGESQVLHGQFTTIEEVFFDTLHAALTPGGGDSFEVKRWQIQTGQF